MNNRMTVAQKLYENHVKESLLSGKPVEYSIKDYLLNNSKQKKQQGTKTNTEKIIETIIKQNKKDLPGIENIHLRSSLLKNNVMQLMNEAETIEQVSDIYNTYQRIIYNTPI